jgi:hypothetical protein
MIEKLADLPTGIDGVRAIGTITPEDYKAVIVPLVEQAIRDRRRLRCLIEVDADFTGMTPAAAWEDVKIGLRALGSFDGCAVVSDRGWVRDATKIAAFLMPCPMRAFAPEDRSKAVEWLASLPEGAGILYWLQPERGIVAVEIAEPLRAQDFDALAMSVDPWIETHGKLRGLVIHGLAFPGWENVGGLLRHLRFVHDHHRKVNRVALAVDGRLAALAPKVAEHFVQAEVRNFGYDDLESALAWAAGSPVQAVSPTAPARSAK